MATVQEETRTTGRGAQIALVAILGVAVLALVYFFFLRSEPVVDTAPVTPAPVATPEETAKPADGGGKGPVETFEVFAPKDPFKPAIATLVTGGGGATPAPGSGTTTNGGAGGGTITGGGDGGGSDSVGGHRVRLVDVFTENGNPQARVQVDGTVYTVSEGERFADNFELLSIQGDCASLLFGDDQFTLCEGEEILK